MSIKDRALKRGSAKGNSSPSIKERTQGMPKIHKVEHVPTQAVEPKEPKNSKRRGRTSPTSHERGRYHIMFTDEAMEAIDIAVAEAQLNAKRKKIAAPDRSMIIENYCRSLLKMPNIS